MSKGRGEGEAYLADVYGVIGGLLPVGFFSYWF